MRVRAHIWPYALLWQDKKSIITQLTVFYRELNDLPRCGHTIIEPLTSPQSPTRHTTLR